MPPFRFRLRFPRRDLLRWTQAYDYKARESKLVDQIRPLVLSQGYLTRAQFLRICRWKSPRTQPLCRRNLSRKIETITRASFACADETLKMDLLRLLDGVDWPTASTILHFGDHGQYPILDYRALWSLGYERPPRYTMEFWLSYLAYTRELASRCDMTVRDVDKALWQYSKVAQPPVPRVRK